MSAAYLAELKKQKGTTLASPSKLKKRRVYMKAIDIVLPPPKTEYEYEKRRENRWQSDLTQLNRYRKKIVVMEESDWLFRVEDFSVAGGKYMDSDGEFITKEEALDAVEWLNRRGAGK